MGKIYGKYGCLTTINDKTYYGIFDGAIFENNTTALFIRVRGEREILIPFHRIESIEILNEDR